MVTVRFSNETGEVIKLMIEPWGAIEPIPAGTKFAIRYDPPIGCEDTSFAEYHNGMIRFWVEGERYDLDINGVSVPT